METELWPRMIWGCQLRGIPVFFASGRLSDRKWKRSRHLRIFRGVWKRLAGVATQSEKDAERFRTLGATNVRVCGNVKYQPLPPNTDPYETKIDRDKKSPAIWTIGSIRKGEEAVLTAAFSIAKEQGLVVVVAPRHLREMSDWHSTLVEQGWTVRLRSEGGTRAQLLARLSEDALAQVTASPASSSALGVAPDIAPVALLVDRHGELQDWYAAADLASVGGTWVPLGGHNLFEAVRAGCCVSFGTHVENVRDVALVLEEEGAGEKLLTASDLPEWVRKTLKQSREKRERAARSATRRLAGAIEQTRSYLCDLRPDLFGAIEETEGERGSPSKEA